MTVKKSKKSKRPSPRSKLPSSTVARLELTLRGLVKTAESILKRARSKEADVRSLSDKAPNNAYRPAVDTSSDIRALCEDLTREVKSALSAAETAKQYEIDLKERLKQAAVEDRHDRKLRAEEAARSMAAVGGASLGEAKLKEPLAEQDIEVSVLAKPADLPTPKVEDEHAQLLHPA